MSIVSIANVADEQVEAAVQQAIRLAGGLPSVVAPGSTVLIKPNMVGPHASGSGRVTDARVTEAVTKAVLERDPARVVIGDGTSVGYDFPSQSMDTFRCLEVSGTADVARRLGVELVDLNRDELMQVRAQDAFVMGEFAVAKTAWEADAVICIPVLKTHVRTGITCGLKNMKGVLPGDEKKRTHRLGLDRGIVDLNRIVRPDFTVVDGVVGLQGTHTRPEDRVSLNKIVSGADVVAVDAVCAAIMGFDVERILHVQLAAQEGLGVADLGRIEVRGEPIAEAATPFVPYHEAAQDRFGAATIIDENACTGCTGEMVSAFVYLEHAGFRERFADLTLIMGTPDSVPSLSGTPVVIGKCARAYRHRGPFVAGCPPHGRDITDAACEALGIDRDVVQEAVKDLHDFRRDGSGQG